MIASVGYLHTYTHFHMEQFTVVEVAIFFDYWSVKTKGVTFSSWFCQCHQCGVEMIRRDFLTGCWSPYLEKALQIVPTYKEPLNGGEVIRTPH